MHMRKKRWARPELAACPYFAEGRGETAQSLLGRFVKSQPVWLELGCGKGVSTAVMARDNPGVNVVAMDASRDVLGVARRNAQRVYGDAPVDNLLLVACDIAYIEHILTQENLVDRVCIFFCNPWTEKKRHNKRRLTHPRQLLQYRKFLKPNGEIWFKTDDDGLFEDSLSYLRDSGFEVTYQTNDLHASGFSPNYVTEHEALFVQAGKKIRFLIARMRDLGTEETV